MNTRSLILPLILIFAFAETTSGQDSVQNLLYTKKGKNTSTNYYYDYHPSNSRFFIYRNCIYNFLLKNRKVIQARVIDIRNDSIYYIHYGTEEIKNNGSDTLRLHPAQLKCIMVTGGTMLSIYDRRNLSRRNYQFVKMDSAKEFPRMFKTLYTPDSSSSVTHETIPYLGNWGISRVYEDEGKMYYADGEMPLKYRKPDTTTPKPRIVRNVVWVTPFRANRINGLNIGLQNFSDYDRPLAIRGVNISADPLGLLASIYGLAALPHGYSIISYRDTVDKSKINDTLSGFSISGGGNISMGKVNGVSINGLVYGATISNGLSITGTQSFVDEFNGVVISGMRNVSLKGRGLQIALVNVCKDLKGIQIGLWNVNSKRSLPFINWDF